MLSPNHYWTNITRPTVDDFLSNRNDVRRGMLACMVVLHAVDYVKQNSASDAKTANRLISEYMKDAGGRSFEFRVIRDFALASKHCHLTSHHPGFESDRYMVATPSILGRMVLGRTFLGDSIGGVTIRIDDRENVNLTTALQGAISFLETEFPELTTP